MERTGHAHETRQERSRATALRIGDATRKLLREKGFDELSVVELAAAAGISVGGFYARFPSKEALAAELLDRDLLTDLKSGILDALAPERCRGLDLRALFERYLGATAAVLSRHRTLLGLLSTRARSAAATSTQPIVREVNEELHGVLAERLLGCRAEIRRPDPERAVGIAILGATAALREVVLFGQATSHLVPDTSIPRLISELAAQATAYLTSPAGDGEHR